MTESDNRCKQLARILRQIIEEGFELDADAVQFIESTYAITDAGGLTALLVDDADGEGATLMELIVFPNEAIQLRLEERLWEGRFETGDEDRVIAVLLTDPLWTSVRFPERPDTIRFDVPAVAAGRYVRRLAMASHPPREPVAAVCRYWGKEALTARVRLRHSRLAFSRQHTDFLRRLLDREPGEDSAASLAGLDFALRFLGEIGDTPELYPALMARKKANIQNLQQAARFEEQLRRSNMETLMLQGVRAPHINPDALREELRLIDRISRAVFGTTEYFLSPGSGEDLGQFDPGDDIGRVIRMLS